MKVKDIPDIKRNKVYIGDASELIHKHIPDNSIHCVITSPPYFGLRSYLKDDDPLKSKEIGTEKTPEEFINNLIMVFKEVKRVLHPRGTVWINMGDSYNGSGKVGKKHNPNHTSFGKPIKNKTYGTSTRLKNFKSKNLIGIPWRLAFALQEDGWYLRQDVIWHKPNPMPESVTDRCTKTHEYVFLLTKSKKYWYDYIAIQEKVNSQYRNKRSVWSVSTKPYNEAHYAVFPPKLIEPCVLAGCPERCCPKCGKGWIRVLKKEKYIQSNSKRYSGCSKRNDAEKNRVVTVNKTIKWKPSCDCNESTFVPGIILDPFFGSGTTGLVANKYGRDYIGIDLDKKNRPIIKKRKISKGLFSMSDLKIKEF